MQLRVTQCQLQFLNAQLWLCPNALGLQLLKQHTLGRPGNACRLAFVTGMKLCIKLDALRGLPGDQRAVNRNCIPTRVDGGRIHSFQSGITLPIGRCAIAPLSVDLPRPHTGPKRLDTPFALKQSDARIQLLDWQPPLAPKPTATVDAGNGGEPSRTVRRHFCRTIHQGGRGLRPQRSQIQGMPLRLRASNPRSSPG